MRNLTTTEVVDVALALEVYIHSLETELRNARTSARDYWAGEADRARALRCRVHRLGWIDTRDES